MTLLATVEAPDGLRVGNEKLIRVESEAHSHLLRLQEREGGLPYLRVAIKGGGCSGLSYQLKFTDAVKPNDIFLPQAGFGVLVDPKSALYLKGTHLGYSDALVGGGFTFTNPNAKASCSCGSSFSL